MEINAPELLPDFRYGLNREAAQLDLLTGRDIQNTVAQPPR